MISLAKVVATALGGAVTASLTLAPLRAEGTVCSVPAAHTVAPYALQLARHDSDDKPVHVSPRDYLPDPHALRRQHKLAGTSRDSSWRSESSELRDLRVTQPEQSRRGREGQDDSDGE